MSISVDAWHVYDAAGDESSEFEHQVRVEGEIFADDSAQKYESPSRFFGYDQSSNFVAPSAARHLCSFSGETQVLMADNPSPK